MSMIFIPKQGLDIGYLYLYNMGGPIIESNTEGGYTHFFEHILYRQNTIEPNPYFLDKLGGNFALATFKEVFYLKLEFPIDKLHMAYSYFLDSLYKTDIKEDIIEQEKKVVIDEIKGQKQRIEYVLMNELYKHFFPKSYLSKDVGGELDSINMIDKKAMLEFRNKFLKHFNPTIMLIAKENKIKEYNLYLEQTNNFKMDFKPIDIPKGKTKQILLKGDQSFYLIGVLVNGYTRDKKNIVFPLLRSLIRYGRATRLQKIIHNEIGLYRFEFEYRFYKDYGIFFAKGRCQRDSIENITTEIYNFFKYPELYIKKEDFLQGKNSLMYKIMRENDNPTVVTRETGERLMWNSSLSEVEDLSDLCYEDFLYMLKINILSEPYIIHAFGSKTK